MGKYDQKNNQILESDFYKDKKSILYLGDQININ